MDILHSEPGPCSDTCQMSCDNGNQVVGIKVEEVTDLKEEEILWTATSTGIETDAAVSCLCVRVYHVLFTLHRYPEFPVLQCVFCLHKIAQCGLNLLG
jgi:hypothetical protein